MNVHKDKGSKWMVSLEPVNNYSDEMHALGNALTHEEWEWVEKSKDFDPMGYVIFVDGGMNEIDINYTQGIAWLISKEVAKEASKL